VADLFVAGIEHHIGAGDEGVVTSELDLGIHGVWRRH